MFDAKEYEEILKLPELNMKEIELIQVLDLKRLKELVKEKKCVHIPGTVWSKHTPAAIIMNLQGHVLIRLFETGMFVYTPKGKK